jgi:hypothetical protein
MTRWKPLKPFFTVLDTDSWIKLRRYIGKSRHVCRQLLLGVLAAL